MGTGMVSWPWAHGQVPQWPVHKNGGGLSLRRKIRSIAGYHHELTLGI